MKNILKLFVEAVRGKEYNYTEISINKAIFLLSIPMIIEMLGESLFAVVDVFFVAKIGINAIATVGLTESVLTLIYSVAWGISGAGTAIVARRVGEGNPEGAGLAAMQVIIISLCISVVVGTLGFVFAEDILRFMGGSDELIAEGVNFTRVIFASSPAIILLYSLGGVLRGAGNASKAMNSLWIANIINMSLDAILIWGLHFGVVGAAIATSVGRTIGVIYQLYVLTQGKQQVQFNWRHIKPDFEVIKNIIKVASGATGQFLISSASWVFLARVLATFGSDVVAGYTIAIRIIIFTILPSWGMANAAATLVGQNLGAGKPDRAESSAWKATFYNMVFLLAVAIVFFIFADNCIRLFNGGEKVVEIGTLALQIICLGYLFFGYGMVLGQALNGAGDTKTPTLLNFICFWLLEIPLAYLLAKTLNFGPQGVFISIAVSESILAVLFIWVFKKGRWKTIEV